MTGVGLTVPIASGSLLKPLGSAPIGLNLWHFLSSFVS